VVLQIPYVLVTQQDAAIMENNASIISAALIKSVEVSVVLLVKFAILLLMRACLFNVQVDRQHAHHWMEVTQYVASQG